MIAAVVQLCSKPNKKKNLAVATALMQRAVRQKAKLIALPEFFSFIGTRADMMNEAEKPRAGLAYLTVQKFAQDNKVFILAGSIPTLSGKKSEKRPYNRSIFFGPDGKELGFYDKIHLFDTEIIAARAYRESEVFLPGSEVKVADTPIGKVGFSVCYDLRFPQLYRKLMFMGARIIFVPSAFTRYTGKDHWLPLLKARAIENQVYIIAPAQYGKHTERKTSYGNSCIIDPWGNVRALAPNGETVVTAKLDFKFLEKVRKELPALKHHRKDLY